MSRNRLRNLVEEISEERSKAYGDIAMEDVTGAIEASPGYYRVDTSSGVGSVTLLEVSAVSPGEVIGLHVTGSNSCWVTASASDGDAISGRTSVIEIRDGQMVSFLASSGSWIPFAAAGGYDSAGNLRLAPMITTKSDGRLAIGDLQSAGFTEPGSTFHIVGADTGGGLRMGDNGLATGNNDFLWRVNSGNAGTGSLECLFIDSDNNRGKIVFLGNSAARLDLFLFDGSLVIGNEADSDPYIPSAKLEVRSGAAMSFAVEANGRIWTNQTSASTGSAGDNPTREMPVYDEAGSFLGYVRLYD